jgi:uncharacterized protein YndB with AHSA1/START domain
MSSFERAPIARVEMLILRPREEVFSAFIQPEIITQFWLSRVSGPLRAGATVHWEFLVKGASADATVEAVVENERIRIAWDDETHVEWSFGESSIGGTLVVITQSGYDGTGDEIIAKALNATGGFTLVLAELKLLLERGQVMNLVRDKARLIELQVALQQDRS